MTMIKPLLCSRLYLAWQHVNQSCMIKNGWTMYGLDRAFNKNFQTIAMDKYMKNRLFKDVHL
jgi:tryptophan-rich sensory protein